MQYKPYFYIIKHLPTQRYYAGCKYSSPDSNNFMTETGYQTSSKIIKQIIVDEGLNSFHIKKIKHFDTKEQVLIYEHKFLSKIDAKNNDMFFNRSNGESNFVNKGGYKLTKTTKRKMSKLKSRECIDKQNAEKRSRSKEVYEKAVNSRKCNGLPWHDEESRNKISSGNKKRWSNDENKEEHSKIMKEYYEVNPVSLKTREKISARVKGNGNPMYGKQHSEETKQKLKEAWKKRKNAKKNQSFSEDDLF